MCWLLMMRGKHVSHEQLVNGHVIGPRVTSFAFDLPSQDVAVGMVHPGYVWTGFQGKGPEKQPGMHQVGLAMEGIVDTIDAVSMENTGVFRHDNYDNGVKTLSW